MTLDTQPSLDNSPQKPPQIALFVTCLINQFRPSAAFAAISLLESVGCDVVVPQNQTCCGQPGYNNGLKDSATSTAKATIRLLEPYDAIVIPSGSCTGMITRHYPALFSDDLAWKKRAELLSSKTWELCQFLAKHEQGNIPAHYQCQNRTITYQDSCSCKRELNNTEAPRELISQACMGATLVELDDPETCCGFGGTFSVKFPDISQRLVSDKTKDIAGTQADIVVSADLGCLLNIAGYLSKQEENPIEVRHIAEVLANHMDSPSMACSTTTKSTSSPTPR